MRFTFNDLLAKAGLEPKHVILMRHRVQGKQIHDIWRANRALVEEYQANQSANCFGQGKRIATHLACFLAARGGKTVFGGMYEIAGSRPMPIGHVDVLSGNVHQGKVEAAIWDLVRDESWEQYEDRLVIDWGGSYIAWRQWAGSTEKPVVEIADQHETPFPGWGAFRCEADELETLPLGWRGALAANRGVYLLVDLDAGGKQYVGSAKGTENLLGRLQGYADGGTNGNLGLTKGHRYQVSILEVAGTGDSDFTIEKIESHWKDKLGTRTYGLNRN